MAGGRTTNKQINAVSYGNTFSLGPGSQFRSEVFSKKLREVFGATSEDSNVKKVQAAARKSDDYIPIPKPWEFGVRHLELR